MNVEYGYLVEYSKRNGLSEPTGKRREAIVTQKQLSCMLDQRLNYIIWNANRINITEYKLNVDSFVEEMEEV